MAAMPSPAAPPAGSVPSRVVHCGEDGHGGYRLQIDFAGIELDDQEILIQFIGDSRHFFLRQG